MSYTKLDSGITESTIWQAPDATRLVWITLLARADQNGYVGASMPGLASLARVPMDACIEAIRTLEAPDPWSRTKEHDGRRIAPADGGWVLLNHAKYRQKQSADDRRERSRVAMAALRARRKAETVGRVIATVSKSQQSEPKLSQAEAEAEAKTLSSASHSHAGTPAADGQSNFDVFWKAYPKKTGKDAAAKAFAKRKVGQELLALMLKAIGEQRRSEQWLRDGGQYIPNPATWLNQGRWQDEAQPPPGAVRNGSRAPDRVATQLETAALMTGFAPARAEPDTIDIQGRLIDE